MIAGLVAAWLLSLVVAYNLGRRRELLNADEDRLVGAHVRAEIHRTLSEYPA